MKGIRLSCLLAALIWASNSFAEDLRSGELLFIHGLDDERIETSDFAISLSFQEVSYQIRLAQKFGKVIVTHNFELDGDDDAKLVAFNLAHYCATSVMFLTVRYGIPAGADILQYRFETHAFDATTLQYLASAPVAFEQIAPHEQGLDIGFPYIMPQPFQVACGSNGSLGMSDFSIFVRPKER